MTRKIMHFESDRRLNGRAGQQLYGLFWDAGLTYITAHVVVHIFTNYSEAVRALGIRERAQLAKEAGVISEEECAARNTLQIKRVVEKPGLSA